MPFAVIAVLILVLLALTAPSEASQSCMTRAEARQHSGSVHLYMHARDHCWDTVPMRKAFQIGKSRPLIGQRSSEARLAPDETAPAQWLDRWADIDPSRYPALARWIETVQAASPIVEPKAEAAFAPPGVVFAAIAIVLTLGTIEVLFRCTIS